MNILQLQAAFLTWFHTDPATGFQGTQRCYPGVLLPDGTLIFNEGPTVIHRYSSAYEAMTCNPGAKLAITSDGTSAINFKSSSFQEGAIEQSRAGLVLNGFVPFIPHPNASK